MKHRRVWVTGVEFESEHPKDCLTRETQCSVCGCCEHCFHECECSACGCESALLPEPAVHVLEEED